LVYQRNPGDTWAFTVIGDRIPIAASIGLIYFGVVRSYPAWGLATLAGSFRPGSTKPNHGGSLVVAWPVALR
jgi:hypothetical protein